MFDVTFDPAAHAYTVDGESVPSITQLVAPLGADYDEAAEDDLTSLAVEAAADRGTTMHAYLAHRLIGGAPEEFELPDAYAPYADAVELFLAEHRIDPYLIEQPLGSIAFAGTPDLVADFDGTLSVLDYKFVSQVAKSKVGAQLGGYLTLCNDNALYPDALYAVQFLPDGVYRLYPADVGQALASFHVCKTLYEIKTKKHPRGRIG